MSLALLGGTTLWRTSINADPQIVVPPYPAAPKPNGFDVYVRAANTMVRANPAVDEVNDGNPPRDPKIRAQQYSLGRKNAWLQKNAAGFSLMRSAVKMQCLAPSARDPMSSPPYGKLRELARCKSIERRTMEMRGDWNGAVQSQIDTVQMGNDMAHGGALISALVGIAIGAIGRDNPWSNVEKLSAIQARAAMRRLEAVYDRRFTLADSLREDKWVSLIELKRMFADSNASWRNAGTILEQPSVVERIRVFNSSKSAITNNATRRLDAQIANAQLPYTTPLKPLPLGDPVSEMFVPGFDKVHTAYARNDAGNALWLVALALRGYKSEHNSYPAKLQNLVPNYLKQVPADPFGSGEELRYKIVGNAYLLWSIGPDGINNNGTPIPFRAGQSATSRNRLPFADVDGKGDYVAGKNR